MRGRPIEVPALFVGGDRDGPTLWGRRNIERFPDTVPNMRGVHVLAGCGHWTQQERAAEVTRCSSGSSAGSSFALTRSLEDSLAPFGRAC